MHALQLIWIHMFFLLVDEKGTRFNRWFGSNNDPGKMLQTSE